MLRAFCMLYFHACQNYKFACLGRSLWRVCVLTQEFASVIKDLMNVPLVTRLSFEKIYFQK